MADCFGSQFSYEPQGDGDWDLQDGAWGLRLERAFHESFRGDCRQVIVVGTDCPQLSLRILHQAFEHLRDHDLVIGPATDGGDYLIGLARHAEFLFADSAWGTETVLMQTLTAALQAKLSMAVLPTLADVNRPEDLPLWENANRPGARRGDRTPSALPAPLV